jgi:hypothetical protein
LNTVKPAHMVTSIKRSHFSCPITENFIWIEPILRGHLPYKATFSLSHRWPLNTGLTMLIFLELYFVQQLLVWTMTQDLWEGDLGMHCIFCTFLFRFYLYMWFWLIFFNFQIEYR